MNGICEGCFKKEDVAVHGDISHIKLSDNDLRCIHCGKVCRCVEDYMFKGADPGIKWLMKNSRGWKVFKK